MVFFVALVLYNRTSYFTDTIERVRVPSRSPVKEPHGKERQKGKLNPPHRLQDSVHKPHPYLLDKVTQARA